jgi:hypothetical protein
MFLGLLDPDPAPLVRGMDPDPDLAPDQGLDPSTIKVNDENRRIRIRIRIWIRIRIRIRIQIQIH